MTPNRIGDLAGGVRPVNLVKRSGDTLRLVLRDPSGVWSSGAPRIDVVLEWRRVALPNACQ